MAIKFLSDINAEGSATDINADGVIKIKDTTILETNATYTMLSDPEGSRKIYLGDGGDRTNYYDNNSHRFRGHGGSGEKMFINSSGQIGIGTTSPASGYKLDIQGAVISNQSFRARGVETGNPQPVADNAHLSGYGIIGNRGTFYVTNNGTVQIGNGTVHNANPAASYTSSSITHYRPTTITSSGYIDFKVDQTDSAAIKMGVSSASTEGFIMTETTGGSHLSTDPVLKFLYNDGTATEYARFTTSGLDVTGRLDVASDLRLRGEGSTLDAGVARLYVDSNNAINIDAGNNGSDIVQIQSDGDMIVPGKMQIGANEVIYSDGSITMAIDVNNNETDRAFTVAQGSSYASLFRVQENGNVGIGTTSPSAKLHVAGAIKTTGDVTMSSNTTLHIGNVDLTTGSGGNTVSVECATSSGTAMNFKTSGGTVGAYMMYQGTTTTRFAGRVEPSGNRTLDLGTDALRWRVLYCETLDSAGQHESNLQDREQPVGQYITGTVLSWKDGKNRPCTNFADHMRMGIAVLGQDSPLVQGAEPVLCTGIVEEGDYLVTSEKEGHAVAIPRHIVKEQLLFDCVIGKALQGGEGESHLIKTWINI